MQYNVTPHTSRIVTELLQKPSSEVRYFPGNQNFQTLTLLNISRMACNLMYRRDLNPPYYYWFMDSPAGFMGPITSNTT
ncbi:hypothetical protein TNCV_3768321 [Trichonephila clavipes]|nr:hypothetical protein TNCV_3768321 [Trichonephila clavipes]